MLPFGEYETEDREKSADSPLAGRKSIEELRHMLDDFRTSTETNNTQGMIDYDYYDGKQLTAAERSDLALRGQPDIVVNRMRVAINGILGIVAKSHTDPKAWPRGSGDQDSSSVATDILRYVTQTARFNRKKVECFKDNLIGGSCAILVGAAADKNIPLSPIRWEEFIYDPRSRKIDFSDARYLGIGKWMYKDDVASKYPGKMNADDGGSLVGDIGGTSDMMADRPINQGWIDNRRRRVFMVELYYRYGKIWNKCTFWYGGVLEEGVSPYLDEYKQPVCPIVAVSCYVDRDNNRYGVVRDMRDLQDEINKRRSKLLHLVNSSQIQARDPSAIEVSADDARLEAARPDGVLPYGWQKVPTTDMVQGQSLLLTEAKNEMERFGPNPAVLGRQGADTSGRALLARQQAGMIELAVVLDQMEDWEQRVYIAIWARVKQFWKAPQYIRVTGDIDAPKFVGINQPIPNPNAGQPVTQEVIDPQTNTPVQAPVMQQEADGSMNPVVEPDTLGYENNVAEMNVDIVVDIQPATASILAEQFEGLMKLIQSSPAYAQQIPPEVMIDLMPLPRKAEVLKKVKEHAEKAQAQNAKQQEQQIEIAVRTAIAKVMEMEASAKLKNAQEELTRAETAQTEAETAVIPIEQERESAVALDQMNSSEQDREEAPPDA